jgi:hypothetical protein
VILLIIKMNPDLDLERRSPSFPVRQMTYWLEGGQDMTEVLIPLVTHLVIAERKNHVRTVQRSCFQSL